MALLYLQNRDKRVIKSGDYVKYFGTSISSVVYALLGEANIIGNATERIYPGKWGHINPLNNWDGIIGLPATLVYQGDNVIFGTGRFGGSTHYTEFEADGTLVMHGDATVWDDIRITPGSFDRPGGSDPSYVLYYPNAGGIGTYLTEWAKNNVASFTVQIPHKYHQGEDIYVHLHWSPGDRGVAESGNLVGWKVDYSWANIDGNFPDMQTADLKDACDGTNHKHQKTPQVAITGSGKTISSMLMCNIRRTDGGVDDTWAGTAAGQLPLLLEVDFHYPINMIGSRTRI
jgi:hypothetical protein